MTSNFEWNEKGEAADMSAEKLAAALARMREREVVDGFLVIRRDAVACEWYGSGHGRHKAHWTASLTKSLVGSLSFLLNLGDGRVKLDDAACRFVSQWRRHTVKSKITLRQLIAHSSGMSDAKPKEDRGAWTGRFWLYPDHYGVAREHAPVLFEPGQDSAYSNPGMAMLGYCLTAALRRSPQKDLRHLLAARVMRPLGVPDEEWILDCDDAQDPVSRNPEVYGGGMPAEVDGLKVYACWGGTSYSPDAVARVGRLMLKGGVWQGRTLIAEAWVRRALEPHGSAAARAAGSNPPSGLGWWLNTRGSFPGLPGDAFAGAGRGLQALLVVPSLELIAVRLGQHRRHTDFWPELRQYFFDPVVAAVR